MLSGLAPCTTATGYAATNPLDAHTLEIGCYPSDMQDLDAKIEKSWDLESLGIRSGEGGVYERFQDTVQFKGVMKCTCR